MAGFKKISLPGVGLVSPKNHKRLSHLGEGLFMPSKRTKAAHPDKGDLPEKRINRKKIFRRAIVMLIFILFIGVIYTVRNNLFSVKKIDVKNSLSCVDVTKLSKDSRILGKNILLLDVDNLEVVIRAKLPCVENLKIVKRFPDSVTINITPKIPVAVFSLVMRPKELNLDLQDATASSQAAKLEFGIEGLEINGIYLTDRTGTFYEQVVPGKIDDLPLAYFLVEDVESGKYISESRLYIFLTLVDKLKTLQISSKSLKVDGHKLIIDGSPKMVLSLDKDPLWQAASLQLILQKAKINSSSVDTVDLRFDKPVVIYSSSKK